MNHAEPRPAVADVWSGPRVGCAGPAGTAWRGSLLPPYGCKKYAPKWEKCKCESCICEFPSNPTEPFRDKLGMRSSWVFKQKLRIPRLDWRLGPGKCAKRALAGGLSIFARVPEALPGGVGGNFIGPAKPSEKR